MSSQLPQEPEAIDHTPADNANSGEQPTTSNELDGTNLAFDYPRIHRPVKRSLKRPFGSSTFEEANKTKRKPQMPHAELCEKCAQIDFSAIVELDATSLQDDLRRGVYVANLGTIGDMAKNRCPLCQLFAEVRITGQGLEDDAEYHLRAYSVFNRFNDMILSLAPERITIKDLPCLAVVSTASTSAAIPDSHVKLLYCHPVHDEDVKIITPSLLRSEVDFDKLRGLLRYCKTKHNHLCSGPQPMGSPLKLIDCYKNATKVSELRVTPVFSDCPPYLALSYVWGDAKRNCNGSKADENVLMPITISDAMHAVKMLGYRYLWVDKFCIDQHNETESEYEINRMDTIYQKADATLMMAAGQDSDAGLPGVAKTSRIPQQHLLGMDTSGSYFITEEACIYAIRGLFRVYVNAMARELGGRSRRPALTWPHAKILSAWNLRRKAGGQPRSGRKIIVRESQKIPPSHQPILNQAILW
ncbi:Inositol hexakisphosphate kinase 1 [Fonsecaea nubica]|uniref:Inositol hexakisphosphate kinase 1 n=1 Tax=Fonsecaea nubica TaxID=856822 RepID=A0A178C4I4_9EURO|nr:Inositol hexakisphosphate kinase 1 [Fonsecaea nubica]OAL23843.1 Inositol hexakisphosphate kinase 1 [Fonsecaea nubica]